MDDDLDDDTERWRDELLGTPSENEAMRREMIARSSQSAHENTLAWCKQRAEARERLEEIDNVKLQPVRPPPPQPTFDEGCWRSFVRHEIENAQRPLRSAIAQLLRGELDKRDADIGALRATIDVLSSRLDRLERRQPGGDGTPARVPRRTESAAEARRRACEQVRQRQMLAQLDADQAAAQ